MQAGIEACLQEISIELSNEINAANRAHGFWVLEQLIRNADIATGDSGSGGGSGDGEHISTILKYVLGAVGDTDTEVLEAAAGALGAVVERVSLDTLVKEVDFIRSCITSTVSDARHRADKKKYVYEAPPVLSYPLPYSYSCSCSCSYSYSLSSSLSIARILTTSFFFSLSSLHLHPHLHLQIHH